MKKMTLTTAALTAMMTLATTSTAFAADPAVNQTGTSTGKVSVKAADDTVPPVVDPNDPQLPNKGPLSLNTVPFYDFGEIKLGDTTPLNDKQTPTAGTHLQVTDGRGSGAGWTVTVGYDKAPEAAWTGTDANSAAITGTGFVFNMTAFTPATIEGADPSAQYNLGTAPSVAPALTVNGDQQTVLGAKADEGMGTWVTGEATAATLQVPANNKVGDYTANLVWTLTDTPAA